MSSPRQNLKHMLVWVLASAVMFCGLAVARFFHSQLPTTIHHRLTLKLESDGAICTGSGVIETVWYPGLKIGGTWFGNAWHVRVRGEAVVVDLGNHGVLFALLTGSATPVAGGRHGELFYPHDPERIPLEAFGIEQNGGSVMKQDSLNALSKRRDTVDLPLNKLPILVRFTTLGDPRSVERVDPNDLPASFGPGVRFVSATVAVTDDPVTTGIENKLVWLQTPTDRPFDPVRLQDELRSKGSFTGGLATVDFRQP